MDHIQAWPQGLQNGHITFQSLAEVSYQPPLFGQRVLLADPTQQGTFEWRHLRITLTAFATISRHFGSSIIDIEAMNWSTIIAPAQDSFSARRTCHRIKRRTEDL
jgi:hypothetical protein